MENNYTTILSSSIAYCRKLHGLTQEQLADLLGISAKAVSKWENRISCPDISFLPQLALIFNISIDELFGKQLERDVVYDYVEQLEWDDDDKFRIGLFSGKKLISHKVHDCKEGINKLNINFKGSPYDIYGHCTINCEKEKRSQKYLNADNLA